MITKRIACALVVWMSVGSCGGSADAQERSTALASTKVTLAAPFLDIRAVTVPTEGGHETNLEVRTEDGWLTVPEPLLVEWDDDPGCPSIEREIAIAEVKVERGTLVVVTTADRDSVVLTKARACRLEEGEVSCSPPETVSATRYWVDADGELEVDEPVDDDPQ